MVVGKIILKGENTITVLTAGGVGYEVMANIRSSEKWTVGMEVSILTYLAVRESALDLYGFVNAEEKDLFEKFLLVSGIGPKTALHLLSLGTVSEISNAIAQEDLAYLTNVSGIGRKTAERILVELKNKMGVGVLGELGVDNSLGDVIEGLMALGYSLLEARNAVKNLDIKGKNSEQLLKEALQRVK
jgi:Holliday junction DNA helicase RuvA